MDGKNDTEGRREEEWLERREGRKDGKTSLSLPMTDLSGNERQRQRKKRVRQREKEGGVNNHTCLHL